MRRAERSRDADVIRGADPFPLPIGPGLAAVVLLTLIIDRTLGLTAFAVTTDLRSGPLLSRVADLGFGTALLSDLVAAVVVVGALVIVDVLERPRSRGGLLATLTLVALVGLQAGAAVAEAMTRVALATDLQLARALLVAGTTAAALIVLRALAEHRFVSRALSEATASAEELAISGRAALVALREDVAGQVRAVMGGAVEALTASTASDPSTSRRLRELADEVLRPLSHRLAVAPVPAVHAAPAVVTPTWRETFAAVGRMPVIPPRSLALIATVLAALRTLVTDQDSVRALAPLESAPIDAEAIGITVTVDWVPLLTTLSELALVLLLAWWGAARFSEILTDARATLGPRFAWIATILGLVVVGVLTLVGPALVRFLSGAGMDGIGPAALLVSVLPLLAATLGATFVRAVEEGREEFARQLADENVRVRRAAARTQAVLAHEQYRLARTLHADVQAAVNAASLVLDRAAREDVADAELVEEAAGRIAGAVERFLGRGVSDLPLSARLDQIRAVWDGVCAVRIDVAPEVIERVDRDPVIRELLVDLVAEGCANAAVHGGAGNVRVRLEPGGPRRGIVDEVVLTVEDDGVWSADRASSPGSAGSTAGGTFPGAARRGLGSEVLRASCTRFTFATDERGSTLTAAVPLG